MSVVYNYFKLLKTSGDFLMRILIFCVALLIWPTLSLAQNDAKAQSTASAEELKAAEQILRGYMVAVADEIGGKLQELGGQEAVLKKFEELGKKHLLTNKDVLHKKAAADYLKLDVWTLGEKQKLVPTAKHDKSIQAFKDIFSGGHGIPPYDYRTLTTKWWDPEFVAKTLRELLFRQAFEKGEVERRKFIEQYLVPRLYRQNDDIEKPLLAYFDGKELVVFSLKYTEIGIYALENIEWFTVESK